METIISRFLGRFRRLSCSNQTLQSALISMVVFFSTAQAFDGSGFSPSFIILSRNDDPGLKLRPAGVPNVGYNVPTWLVEPDKATQAVITRDITQAGDGFDASILDGDMLNRTHSVYNAGDSLSLEGVLDATLPDGSAVYRFPKNPVVDLTVRYHPKGNDGFATVDVRAVRKVDGWISIAYAGAPEVADSDAQEAWQPIIWTERRFPALPYLTPAYMCMLPGSFVRSNGNLRGVMADPSELPFQPLPVFDNSRFGVSLRTPENTLRPTLFFPMMGGSGSKGEAGEVKKFRLRLVDLDTDVTGAFETVARRLFGFRDLRHNALGPLNDAMHRMLDYGMSEFAHWNGALRGCGYGTDVPGAVKNVSSLNPLELAMVTGREDLFRERAKPILEYLLSREKFLFSLDPEQKIQSPSRALLGPAAPLSEFAALHQISHGATPVFKNLAEELYSKDRVLNLQDVSKGATWWNALALYRSTQEQRWLDLARKGADVYLESRMGSPATKFEDPDSQGIFFWIGFVPRWIDLLMLYEETGEQRYLDAAQKGARLNALFVWMCPSIPNATLRVNDGGKAPVYWYLGSRGFPAIPVEEESAEGWRLSEMGLGPESAATSWGHRGIFMAHYAPWMLRLASLTGDTFLHDIARSAVIGRYQNFPGYHINTARTTVYEKADYPLRPHDQLSYNSMHYNHVWPLASMVLDYMVSDVWARSKGEIDFPNEYIEGYAYLQSRFYGHTPGRIYDLEKIQLWMPQGLIEAGQDELNTLTGYNQEGVAVIFSNQAFLPVTTRLKLNQELVRTTGISSVLKWIDNERIPDAEWDREGVSITVPAQGIAAVFMKGARPQLAWSPGKPSEGLVKSPMITAEPGDTRAMLLSFGSTETWAYVYLREDDSQWREVRLEVKSSTGTEVLEDKEFPFEFSIPVQPDTKDLNLRLEAISTAGGLVQGKEFNLELNPAIKAP